MLRMSWVVAVLVSSLPHTSAAQRIPTTIQAAEAEGVAFPRGATPSVVASDFTRAFGGTSERRCVVAPTDEDSLPGGSLRSGEFILRGGVGSRGPMGNEYGRARKLIWEPLHNPYVYPTRRGLLVRGVRIGYPADTLRLAVAHAAYPGTRNKYKEAGYPSGFNFPSAGRWLMVATSGADWGCFVLTIEPAADETTEIMIAAAARIRGQLPPDSVLIEVVDGTIDAAARASAVAAAVHARAGKADRQCSGARTPDTCHLVGALGVIEVMAPRVQGEGEGDTATVRLRLLQETASTRQPIFHSELVVTLVRTGRTWVAVGSRVRSVS